MTDKVNEVLWCKDCLLKHSRDLLSHAMAGKNPKLKKLAEESYEVALEMNDVKDSKSYGKIRDLEHRLEDLMTGLRNERKNLQSNCKSCGDFEKNVAKDLNNGDNQEIHKGVNMKIKEKSLVVNALAGNVIGKGISVATPMFVSGSTMGIQNKTIANLGLGVTLTGLSLYGKLKKYDTIGAVAGTNLIANEIIDMLVKPIVTPTAVFRSAPIMTNGNGGIGVGKAQYTNGGLIFVD